MAEQTYEPRLKTVYRDAVRPALVKEFGYKNALEVPRVDKVVLNMGVGEAVNDSKKVTTALADLALIAGQKPAVTKSRKSIATFKLRENMAIGGARDAAPRPHVRVPRSPDQRRAAARPRFPRPQPEELRRARQLRDGHQGAHHFPGDQLRRSR